MAEWSEKMKNKTIFYGFAALLVLLFSVAPVAAAFPEDLVIDAQLNGPTPVTSSPLADGTCYKIDASGTFQFGTCLFGDAEYQDRTCPLDVYNYKYWKNPIPIGVEPTPPELDWIDLLVNDMSVEWGAYNDDHAYSVYQMGDGNALTFRISDSASGGTIDNIGAYGDNSGSLAVTISEVSENTETLVVPLYAGKDSMCTEPIGTVSIYTEGENIYVRYQTTDGWFLEETHFDFGTALTDFQTLKGNPQVGLFRFGDDGLNTQDISYVINKADAGIADPCAPFFVATHAAVINPGDIIAPAGYNPVVVSNALGLKGDGTAVLLVKQDPANGLVTDYEALPRELFELYGMGMGGSVIVSFDCPVINGAGDDLAVIEVTNGPYPPETATVEVSDDMVAWTLLGTATSDRTAPISTGAITKINTFDLGSLTSAKYVRITDTTNGLLFAGLEVPDGFDIDGIEALQNCVGADATASAWGNTCDTNGYKFVEKGNWATYFQFDETCPINPCLPA
jgi:hypothetical protein